MWPRATLAGDGMSYDLKNAGFSMPFGASLYPSPPYEFRDAEQISICFTANPESVAQLLPPGLEVADSSARCEIRLCCYHWSTFGPFLETYALIRVRDQTGRLVWYLPLIFTDNEVPLAAGRELWGYPKKLAYMRWSWGRSDRDRPSNELLHFSTERPSGSALFSATFTPERQADPSERHGLSVICLRYLPPSEVGRAPAAHELIELGTPKTIQRDATGAQKFWAGKASLTMIARSQIDPWFLLTPLEITGAFWQISDFALPMGTVVHDYLTEGVR